MREQETRCKHCNQIIEVLPGHRPRQYCSDAHRQAAHRERVEAARMLAEEKARQEQIQRERATLLSRYGNLLPQTLDLLQSFQSRALIEKVLTVIRAEQDWARQSEQQERNAIIEQFLLTGEQLGFPKLTNDDFILESGVESWLSFIEEADLGGLYQACDIVHIQIQARAGRAHLAQLAPNRSAGQFGSVRNDCTGSAVS